MSKTIKATKLHAEMIAWANGDLSNTAPSQLADSPHYHLLGDALDFELGHYTCSGAEQRRKAIAAIKAFCEATEDYE